MNTTRYKQFYPALERNFFLEKDFLLMAKKLLGVFLCTHIDTIFTVGMITETEAYSGSCDASCHAFGGKKTARTQTMYSIGGHAYVYLCYGMHRLINIVIGAQGVADAVLIRAIRPIEGIEIMEKRRGGGVSVSKKMTDGPAKLTQALGITMDCNGLDLTQSHKIWLSKRKKELDEAKIKTTTRIGITDKEAATYPWRFVI